MELNKLLQEVQSTEYKLARLDEVITCRKAHGVELVVSVDGDLSFTATADVNVLYGALLAQQEVLTERKKKLGEAVEFAQKAVTEFLAE